MGLVCCWRQLLATFGRLLDGLLCCCQRRCCQRLLCNRLKTLLLLLLLCERRLLPAFSDRQPHRDAASRAAVAAVEVLVGPVQVSKEGLLQAGRPRQHIQAQGGHARQGTLQGSRGEAG